MISLNVKSIKINDNQHLNIFSMHNSNQIENINALLKKNSSSHSITDATMHNMYQNQNLVSNRSHEQSPPVHYAATNLGDTSVYQEQTTIQYDLPQSASALMADESIRMNQNVSTIPNKQRHDTENSQTQSRIDRFKPDFDYENPDDGTPDKSKLNRRTVLKSLLSKKNNSKESSTHKMQSLAIVVNSDKAGPINDSDYSNEQNDEDLENSRTPLKQETKIAAKISTKSTFGMGKSVKEEVNNSEYNFLDLAKSKDSASLLKSMSFNVDISKLYTVLASACTNQANPYCPVQMKINDKWLIEKYGGQYLVQLWSQDMELVYERVRKQPLANRNLNGRYFIFQEDETSKDGNEYNNSNNVFDAHTCRQDRYKVVKIGKNDRIKEINIEIIEDTVDDPNAGPSPIEHKCAIWKKKNEASKETRIFLVIADSRTVSYIDLTPYLNNNKFTKSVYRAEQGGVASPIGSSVPMIQIRRSKLKKTVMQVGWKIHQIQEIMPAGECALVCEDISKSELVFFHLKDLTEKEAIFQPLGPHITAMYRPDETESYDSIVNYQALMCYQQSLETYKLSAIVLRKSGSIDFYYDFRLVETSEAIPGKLIYTAIDQDFTQLHFKCYQKSDDDEKVVHYSCNTSWKQRVGILSSTIQSEEPITEIRSRIQNKIESMGDENMKMSVTMKRFEDAVSNTNVKMLLHIDAETFCVGLHMKVSGYLRLYSSFINAGRQFFLAHNRFVSIFNLAKDQWTDHHDFQDTVRQIFRNRHIGCQGSSKYDIGVLVGDSSFRFYKFQNHGNFRLASKKSEIKIDGKITTFQQDQQNDTAFYFTVEENLAGEDSSNASQSINSANSDTKVSLQVLIDKEISDITPIEHNNFIQQHKKFTIAMLYNSETGSKKKSFSIILDSISDDNDTMQEQLKLELSEDNDGGLFLDKEEKAVIDHTMVFEKTAGVGTQQNEEMMLGQIKFEDAAVTISNKHIILHNNEMEIKQVFENRNVCNFIYADKVWVYALNNRRVGYDNKLKKQGGAVMNAGLYVYDFSRLLEGTIEVHDLSNALVGANSFIDYDVETQTISFINSYAQIIMMPLPHRNTMKFFGMGDKEDYLIWRQQDGTFTALDKKHQITMWSTVTGKIIQTQSNELEEEAESNIVQKESESLIGKMTSGLKGLFQDKQRKELARKSFGLYQANSGDHTYMGNWNSFEKWSVSLVVSAESIESPEASQPKKTSLQSLRTYSNVQQSLENVASSTNKIASKAHQLDDSYVAFDQNSVLMSFQAQPDCKKYKFKVLKMGDAESIGTGKTGKNQSSIHMMFGKQKKEIQWTEEFNFYFFVHTDPQQRPYIYFNRELDRMLVQRQNDFTAMIYSNSGVKANNEVDWKILYEIHRYPIILKGLSTANFLFSPSFDRFIDIDFIKAEFVIKQSKDENVVARIPAGMITISFKGRNKSEAAISALASRIRFHSENEIQIITKEGLDCILNYDTQIVQSVAAVDNFDPDDFSHPHALLEQTRLKYKNTVQRLMRSCNRIKQQRAHYTSYLKYEQPKLTESEVNEKIVKMTYEMMFSVDFTQDDCFIVELSFTMLDWIIMERIIKDKTFDFSNVDEKQLLQMCFNTFPRIRSVFHHLAENQHVCNLNMLQRLFDSANRGLEMFGGQKVTLPIYKDEDNETPMDACLNERQFNSKLVGFLFANTKDYPILHSSHICKKAVCRAIEFDVPGIVEYLEARMIKSPHLSTKFMEANELYNEKKSVVKGYEYAIEEFPIWVDKKRVSDSLFDPKGFPKKLRLCFFDIPNIMDMSEESDEFFNVLAESDNLDLFNAQIIHILINKAWSELRQFFFWFLMFPYLVLLFSYSFWQNFCIVDIEQQYIFETAETQQACGKAACILILLMCSFVVSQEIYQCARDPVQYMKNAWNFLDLCPLGFAAFGPTLYLLGYKIEQYHTVRTRNELNFESHLTGVVDEHPTLRQMRAVSQVVSSMMLWMKFLYFFRTQKEFGYLIRMIIEVIKDMITFLVVMLVSLCAFTDAVYSLSNNNFAEDHILKDFSTSFYYVFFNAMGEFSMDGFEENIIAWILFFCCALFNLIIMLNLLIAIISDTYSKVASTQEEYALKERAGVVSDLRDFAVFRKFVTMPDPRNYLFIAINEEAQSLEGDALNIYDVNERVIEIKQQNVKLTAMVKHLVDIAEKQAMKQESDQDTQEMIKVNPLKRRSKLQKSEKVINQKNL